MFSGTATWLGASAVGGGAVLIPKPTRSLSFTAASSQSLNLSHANWGSYDRAKWSYSVWFQRASTGAQHTLAAKSIGGGAANTEFFIIIQADDKINFVTYSSGPTKGELKTTATYTSTVNWYHLLIHYDGQNATAGDRMRMWVNGSEVTGFDIDTNPAQAAVQTIATANMRLGAYDSGGSAAGFYNGLKYQEAFYSGVLVPIADVYNAGAAKDLSATGLYSLLNTNATDALEDDYVISTNWTNNGTVVKSTTIP